MTGRNLLYFLATQSAEILDREISCFNNETEEFVPVESVYLHDENDEEFGDVLDHNSIVIELA